MVDSNNNENNDSLISDSGSDELINSNTPEELESIDRIEKLRAKHAKQTKALREGLSEAADKNVELGTKLEEREDELLKKNKENEALRKALLKQKKLANLTESERQMSESERVGKMALDIIDKRLEERYGNR